MALRALATVILVSLLSGPGIGPPAIAERESRVSADSAEQRTLAAWAIGRYEMAGLDLPPIHIVFAGDGQAGECGGNPARTYFHETPTVMMCWGERPFVLLHELAHIWVARNVPPADRDTFMAMREDVREWTGADVPWRNQGAEHAANVIAWGLADLPYPDGRTRPTDNESLRDAFVFLTGAEPLHHGEPPPAAPDREGSSQRAGPPVTSGR